MLLFLLEVNSLPCLSGYWHFVESWDWEFLSSFRDFCNHSESFNLFSISEIPQISHKSVSAWVFQICPRKSEKKLGSQNNKFLTKIRCQFFLKENFTCHEFEKKKTRLFVLKNNNNNNNSNGESNGYFELKDVQRSLFCHDQQLHHLLFIAEP